MEIKIGNFSRAVGIIGYVTEKIIRKSGVMFRRIQFAKDWYNKWKVGNSKVGCSI